MTKDELRSQIDKLEQASATLRAKGREAARTAKAASARIAELEARVVELERTSAAPVTQARTRAKPTSAGRPPAIEAAGEG